MRSRRIAVEVCGRVPKSAGLSRAELLAAAEYFAGRSAARCAGAWHGVAVHVVRDAESDRVHRAVMGVEGATDVITQAYDAIPPEEPGLWGELFVNTDQAVRAAPKRAGWSVADEVLLYVAHGMDHLSGAEDAEPSEYAAMRRRELGWLRDWRAGKGAAK